MNHRGLVIGLLIVVCLSGCGPRVILQPKNPTVPVGIDLSGRWQLNDVSAGTIVKVREAAVQAAGGRISLVDPKKQSRNSRKGALAHMFIEVGRELKITQTDDGLFISFDRSIVEEYRFGENRQVNVGPVVASRVSGWEGQRYVIETLDEDYARLVDAWRLSTDGSQLLRTITIVSKNDPVLSVKQVFDRQ